MPIGSVKFFKTDKGFRFIKPEEGGGDLFFHISDVQGRQELQEGMRVSYEPGKDERTGKAKATNVRTL